jgi:glycine betaine/choline ABC-type transport system substrate-binding protein
MKKLKKFIPLLLIVAILSMFALTGCGTSDENVINITHKNYTEQRITGQLLSIYIEENTDYETNVQELAGTMLCYAAVKSGEADLYAEFTGSAYGAILGQTEVLSVEETYNYVKTECEAQDGITWLNPLGWNNTYVLSVTRETAEEYDLETISDLVPYAQDMIIGSDNEFIIRTDGMDGMMEAYGIESFADEKSMDQGLTYAAVDTGELDVNVSYSTDGRIAKYDLVNLEDDLGYFPPYYVTPIMTLDFAEAHPDLVELLNKLNYIWTETEMQQYNLQVDDGADVTEVATEMLRVKGLIA